MQTLVVDGCQTPVSLSIDRMENVFIRNCPLLAPWLYDSKLGEMTWCNLTLDSIPPLPQNSQRHWLSSFKGIQIRQLNLYQVTINGTLPPTEGLTIGTLASDASSVIPPALSQRAKQQQTLEKCPAWPNQRQLMELKAEALNNPTTPQMSY